MYMARGPRGLNGAETPRYDGDERSYREGPGTVAKILVETETPIDRGWEFLLAVAPDRPGDARTEHRLRLSWADYELWSGGAVAPERVAAAVAAFFSEALEGAPMPAAFDAAIVRRKFPEADRRVPALLGEA
jgi:hypothetical protein